jgi:hypothetical protein
VKSMINNFPFLSKASARRPSLENSKLQNRHQCCPEESSSASRSLTVHLFDPALRFTNFSVPERVINSAAWLTGEYAAQQFLYLYSFSFRVTMCGSVSTMFLTITGFAFSASAIINNEEESKELELVTSAVESTMQDM